MDRTMLYGKIKSGLMLALALAGLVRAWCSLLLAEPDFALMFFGVGIFALAACFVWTREKGIWRFAGRILYLAVCIGLFLANSDIVVKGGSLALERVMERVNRVNNFNLTLPDAQGAGTVEMTFSILLFLSPQILILCYGMIKQNVRVMGLLYLIPVFASGFSQSFPDTASIVAVIFTMGMLFADSRFKASGESKNRAILMTQLSVVVILVCANFLVLPPLDIMYDRIENIRKNITIVVNEQIWPNISVFNNFGKIFRNGTIEGSLSREGGFSYIRTQYFEVTVDEYPQYSVYLRGFAGDNYTGSEWEAEDEGRFKQYYEDLGFAEPGDYAELINDTYEILKLSQPDDKEPVTMTVKELGGDNEYSLYPYGAKLPLNGTVQVDGSFPKQDSDCVYEYYPIWTYNEENRDYAAEIEGGINRDRTRYRQYVYDNYLDYPGERMPDFMEWLENNDPAGDGVWECVYNVINLLEQTAVYNLNVSPCPLESDFVENFLLEQREGYCAHFASSAVLIFRSMGIPARYVTGYCASPEEFSENQDGTYTAVIEDRQAHAWAEIYLDAFGWVPVEVTPADIAFMYDNRMEMLGQIGAIAGIGAADYLDDGTRTSENQDDEDDEDEDDEDDEDEDEDDESDEDEEEDDEVNASNEENVSVKALDVIKYLAVLIVFVAAVFVLFILGSRHGKRKNYGRMQPAEKICSQYMRLLKIMLKVNADERIKVDGECFVNELKRLCEESDEDEIRAFLGDVEQCSFGNRQPDEDSLDRAEKLCGQCRIALYKNMPFPKRAAAKCMNEW